MKLMIVGAEGSLGVKLGQLVEKETNWAVTRVTRQRLVAGDTGQAFDTASRADWRTVFEDPDLRPDVVVNAAAMTNVDGCETRREEAWANNVTLVEMIATECKRHDKRFIQISSDYIFDGHDGPYLETATPNPINYYGRTKLAAENACIRLGTEGAIIRTMWLYGEAAGSRPSFVQWIVESLLGGSEVRVVTDEVGNPTLVDDVAYGIIKAIDKEINGVVNIAGPEIMSRWEFTLAIAAVYGLDVSRLKPVTSAELQRPAKRPLRSGLISLRAQTALGLRLTRVIDGLEITRIVEQRMAREI